jgi:hypothetical protein
MKNEGNMVPLLVWGLKINREVRRSRKPSKILASLLVHEDGGHDIWTG